MGCAEPPPSRQADGAGASSKDAAPTPGEAEKKVDEWVAQTVERSRVAIFEAVESLSRIPKDQPVRGVAPDDVGHYARWLIGQAARPATVGLPGADEWNVAAPAQRGGAATKAADLPPGLWGQSAPQPPSALEQTGRDRSWCGAIGMRGNVRELVIEVDKDGKPLTDKDGKPKYQIRGGSWRDLEGSPGSNPEVTRPLSGSKRGDWETGFRLVLRPDLSR